MSYEEANSHAARLIPNVTQLELGGNQLLLEVCIYFPYIWQLNVIRALPCRQSVYTKSESHHSTDNICQADSVYKIYNKRHLQTLKLLFGSVMRLALKSETGKIHANIWWDRWTFKNKQKVPPPLSGGIYIAWLLSFEFLLIQRLLGLQHKAEFHFPPIIMIRQARVWKSVFLFFLVAHSSHCPLSHVILFLRNDNSVLMLQSLLPAPMSAHSQNTHSTQCPLPNSVTAVQNRVC